MVKRFLPSSTLELVPKTSSSGLACTNIISGRLYGSRSSGGVSYQSD